MRGNDCADERDSQQASVDRHGFCPRQALARRLVTRRGGARGVPLHRRCSAHHTRRSCQQPGTTRDLSKGQRGPGSP
jgi:hypothetical protein